jgi:hypothetical protein
LASAARRFHARVLSGATCHAGTEGDADLEGVFALDADFEGVFALDVDFEVRLDLRAGVRLRVAAGMEADHRHKRGTE